MGKTKALTPEQELEICEMYEQVERARPVAEAFGVSVGTIYRVLRRHDIPRTHRHPKPNRGTGSNHKGIDRSRVGELYECGSSFAEIAREMGCSYQTVCYHLERFGLYEPSKRKAAIDALVSQILELHGQGMSDYEIADELGVSRYVVNYRIHKVVGPRGKGKSFSRERVCPRCGKRFETMVKNQEFCSTTCRNAAHTQRRDDVRRVNTDGPIEEIPLREIYDRDRGRCYICGGRTDWSDYRIVNGFKVCGPRYPSRDHVIALHNGGTHTRDNIRLACWECNTLKSDKGQMCLPMAI